jgi:hypothetical protein
MEYEKAGLLVETEIRRIILKFVSSGGWRYFLITALNHGVLLQGSWLIHLKVGVIKLGCYMQDMPITHSSTTSSL